MLIQSRQCRNRVRELSVAAALGVAVTTVHGWSLCAPGAGQGIDPTRTCKITDLGGGSQEKLCDYGLGCPEGYVITCCEFQNAQGHPISVECICVAPAGGGGGCNPEDLGICP